MALQVVDTETGELQPVEENKKEAKMYTHFGVCRFCGQTGMVDSEHEEEPQDVVNEAVTLQCTCDRAAAYRSWLGTIEQAKQNLKEIAKGVPEDIVAVAEMGLHVIAKRRIDQIQIHFGNSVLKIQAKKSGNVLVQMTRTEKNAAEA